MKPPASEPDSKAHRFMPGPDRRLGLPIQAIRLSRREASDSQFELDFMEEVLEQDPCNEDALALLGHAYTRRGDYERGLDLDQRLARLRPADPTVYYNLACSFSLLRRMEEAFGALERAVSLGYGDLNHILKDPDLVNLRGEARFGDFVKHLFKRSPVDS